MTDAWVNQLQSLNGRITTALSDMGSRDQRRQILQQAGAIKPLRRLAGAELQHVLGGRPLVGVDGSINTFGNQFPYYIDLLRAVAKPSQGDNVVLKDVHCPMPPEEEEDEEVAQRNDAEVRQRKLADLEVRAALAAIDLYRPAVILMDGPLVRFDMRTKDSFLILRDKVITENILLFGCIENIESRVLRTVMGDAMPPGWRTRFDRDLLWDTLDYGEVLEIARPAKGLSRQDHDEEAARAVPIRTWFMRASYDPGVVGLDMLEAQVDQAAGLIDSLFTLSPPDGRGIPIWLDLVDREVRLTDVELAAYLDLLEPGVKRLFRSKRDARFY
ncbi:MAG TPA: DNA double-strand break repair nuclease NurA [Symbiobacteriaceae bacterium]|jgi:hypothetical protein|nr:DNA double-strand break repair nuclease NurA [Symbiobacteriaceae bacterium]